MLHNEYDIIIRPYEKSDYKILRDIRNNPLIQFQLITHFKYNNPQMVTGWIRRKTRDKKGVFLVISDLHNSTLGFLQAKDIDLTNRTCYAGIALHPSNQKIGIFPKAFGMFENFLIDNIGIRKILVEILSDNLASLKSFTRIGYSRIGIMHEHYFCNGAFYDIVLMEKIFHR
ncbi:MAG: GNAT family N-acetyltransferase [Candidatus Methanofastidiosa archaeon]|nr:GNAT family N-acetyltransferase [Candidatus Methanofastidiosa archaeon]